MFVQVSGNSGHVTIYPPYWNAPDIRDAYPLNLSVDSSHIKPCWSHVCWHTQVINTITNLLQADSRSRWINIYNLHMLCMLPHPIIIECIPFRIHSWVPDQVCYIWSPLTSSLNNKTALWQYDMLYVSYSKQSYSGSSPLELPLLSRVNSYCRTIIINYNYSNHSIINITLHLT